MNDKFNSNEVRKDCNGNIIEKPFLYSHNETMKLLGQQTYSWLLAPEHEYNKEFENIMNAHFECDDWGKLEQSLRSMIYGFAMDFFSLGVIVGKRKERERKNE